MKVLEVSSPCPAKWLTLQYFISAIPTRARLRSSAVVDRATSLRVSRTMEDTDFRCRICRQQLAYGCCGRKHLRIAQYAPSAPCARVGEE